MDTAVTMPVSMSDPFGMAALPQFQVFDPIVISDSIDVMNLLPGFEVASKKLTHYQPMLKDIASTISLRVIGNTNNNIGFTPIAIVKLYTSAFPLRVILHRAIRVPLTVWAMTNKARIRISKVMSSSYISMSANIRLTSTAALAETQWNQIIINWFALLSMTFALDISRLQVMTRKIRGYFASLLSYFSIRWNLLATSALTYARTLGRQFWLRSVLPMMSLDVNRGLSTVWILRNLFTTPACTLPVLTHSAYLTT